jgi:hypothetical protein
LEPQRIENGKSLMYRLAPIQGGQNGGLHPCQRQILLFGDNLHQLHATRSDTAQEKFTRRDLLAGAAVLDGSVYYEMVIASAAQHPSERLR